MPSSPSNFSKHPRGLWYLASWLLCASSIHTTVFASPPGNGAGNYQTSATFVSESFDGKPPKPKVLWLRGELRKTISGILTRPYTKLRIRYWAKNQRSVWVLEAIGKERPITTGLVVNNGQIERLRVLAFRESRGWEIRHEFFTQQFHGLGQTPQGKLDKPIDGITGATLSVRAMKRLARIALLLHDKVITKPSATSRPSHASP